MENLDYDQQDDIDLNNIQGKIQIWLASGILDGGTIILNCWYEDKLFHIISKQAFIKDEEMPKFLYLNTNSIIIGSEEEKIILNLIKESINAANPFWFLPKFIKIFLWSKRKRAYSIEIFKKEILNFASSNKHLQIANMQPDLNKNINIK